MKAGSETTATVMMMAIATNTSVAPTSGTHQDTRCLRSNSALTAAVASQTTTLTTMATIPRDAASAPEV